MRSSNSNDLKNWGIFLSPVAHIIVAIIFGSFFVKIAFARLVAPDEGYYALAAKLVAQGKHPYIDFFYPQMPLLPYVYGAWVKIWGSSWLLLRTFSAILTSVLGVLIWRRCNTMSGKVAGIASILLFTLSQAVFAWYVTVETYALSTLLLFSGYLILQSPKTTRLRSRFFISGILIGLAVDTRLFFIALAPLFILEARKFKDTFKNRLKVAAWFLLGLCIGLLPSLYFFLQDPQTFWFNNLGYHLIRSDEGFFDPEELRVKWKIVRVLLGATPSRQFAGIQFAILFFSTVCAAFFSLLQRRSIDLAAILALALFILNFVPTPAYNQYFCTLYPFLIVSAVSFWRRSYASKRLAVCRNILAIWLLVLFCRSAPYDLIRYTKTGLGVIGIGTRFVDVAKISSVKKVSEEINTYTKSGDQVLTLWPGYLLETHAVPPRGMEDHFAWVIAPKLNPEDIERYHLITPLEIRERVRLGAVALAVFHEREVRRYYGEALEEGGFQLVNTVGPIQIYKNLSKF